MLVAALTDSIKIETVEGRMVQLAWICMTTSLAKAKVCGFLKDLLPLMPSNSLPPHLAIMTRDEKKFCFDRASLVLRTRNAINCLSAEEQGLC